MHLPTVTILLTFALVISQPHAHKVDPCYQKLSHDCYYDMAKKYPGIEEFEFFWVEELDRRNLSLRGAVYVSKVFHRFEGTLKGNRFSFALSLQNGITYRFEGRFLPGGRKDKEGRIAIDARLIKLSGSKKIARNVKLEVRYGRNQ